jgi:hypothetical protein
MKTINISLTLSDGDIRCLQDCGESEWGVVLEKPDIDHVIDFINTLKTTRRMFPETPEETQMHGMYKKGSDVVLAHTGISPNSPIRASLLSIIWNETLRAVVESNSPVTRPSMLTGLDGQPYNQENKK